MVKKQLKQLYYKLQEHSPYRFAEFLDTPQEDIKIDEARKQIREMLQYCFFPIIALIFLTIYAGGMDAMIKDGATKWTEKEGSGWVLVGFIYVFIVWAWLICHISKRRILHSNPHPTEKN